MNSSQRRPLAAYVLVTVAGSVVVAQGLFTGAVISPDTLLGRILGGYPDYKISAGAPFEASPADPEPTAPAGPTTPTSPSSEPGAFDSPLDSAVEVNLLGAGRVATAIAESGSKAHLVAVSTAYVAGSRRGEAPELPLPETPFAIGVDWRSEVAAARRARADVDAASRDPKRLAEFHGKARHELGAAGSPLLAEKTEKIRDDWVKERMVEAGRARAQSLGWPDAYAYTKSLGERALLESRGDVPVSIVRPSIIESSYAEPFPGWIRGFRMAEPVIISFARGLLREFPGVPEGIVDVIPVDLVAATIIRVAARGPEPEPQVVQVASGSVNPLRYRRLVDTATDLVDDTLGDLEKMLLVAELDLRKLQFAFALDETLVGTVDHDVADGRVGQKLFQWP